MTIYEEIARLEGAANRIKTKTAELGLIKDNGSNVDVTDKLQSQAEAIENIANYTGTQKMTDTLTATKPSITIPTGYHDGSGSISADTMSAPTISLSNESQTINCKDKLMGGNITIPASNVYYTGSAAPDSSTPGKDGDLFLVI